MSSLIQFPLKGIWRRVVYVTLYEAIAILVSSIGLAVASDNSAERAVPAAVAASVVAVIWNYIFNTFFERWEAKQAVRGRNLRRRIVHAIGFEGGLIIFLVPMFAWWFEVSLWHAFLMDLGLLVFFLIYTFVFAWCFDRVFGLPASATAAPEESKA